MANEAKTIIDLRPGEDCSNSTFVSPAAYDYQSIARLHARSSALSCMVRFAGDRLADVCAALNATGLA
jgi:delta 1-pyrroline-5-carboxylate dehydrogenase